MNKTPVRLMSLAIVAIFLVGAMVTVADPGAFQIGSNALTQQPSQTWKDQVSDIFGTQTGSTWNYHISFQDNNPLSVWSASNSNAYVISVPSGSLFSQNAQASYSITATLGGYPNYGVNWVQEQEQVSYYSMNPSSPHYNSWYVEYTSSWTHWDGAAFYGTVTGNMPSYNFNVNSSSPYQSQYGIYKFSAIIQISSGWNGGTSTKTLPAAYAEVYVMPGTGSLNPPSTVQVNHAVQISGSTSYGTYYLLVTAPDGTQTTINIGTTTNIDQGFTKSYTPTQLGKYQVELVNSVVKFSTTQFFSASIVLPKPAVQILTVASSGYFTVGQNVQYKVTLQYGTSLPLQFNLYIWSGPVNQEPTNNSGQFIEDNIYVSPSYSNSTYTYTGSFSIPNNALQTGAVSVLIYAYFASPNGTIYASNPASVQISVGHASGKVNSFNWMGDVEAVIVSFVSMILAVIVPDTKPMKGVILASGVLFALGLAGLL